MFEQVGAAVLEGLRACPTGTTVLAICISPVRPSLAELWAISHAGARDILVWPQLPGSADQVVHGWRGGPPLKISPTHPP